MRLGAQIPTLGDLPSELGIGPMARTLEGAGFDSVWMADHIVMPDVITSPYPFSDDGSPAWETDRPWFDVLAALALALSSTSRVEVGTAVLVLPLRHPIALAKFLATLDVQSGGRVTLGVGVGWLAEEFRALGLDFSSRSGRMSECIQVLRATWSGGFGPFHGEHFDVPLPLRTLPTPAHHVPILIGGNTDPALRRAALEGDGWFGLQRFERLDLDPVEKSIRSLRAHAEEAGRDPAEVRIVLRIIHSAGEHERIADRAEELEALGIDDLAIDVDWAPGEARRAHDAIRERTSRSSEQV
jgi:probable F420-dependent oxidoreductase